MRIVGRDDASPKRNEADPRLRLLVVDSAPVLLEGLSALLRRQPEFEVFSATDTRDLPSIARLAPIDVAIVDIASRSRDGWNDVRKIQETLPAARVVVMDEVVRDYPLRQAMRRRLAGLIIKHDPIRNLAEALLGIGKRDFVISVSVLECGRSRSGAPAVGLHLLTQREADILRLIGDGWSMRIIAERLRISEHTLDNHKTRILRKLGMHRIVDLVRFAIGMGLSFVDPKNCFPPGPESESA
jgi:DNA-binding NarL/FixJ family response regulator